MLVLNYMGTTSDQLSGYGNHFTDVASNVRRRWDTKASLIDVFATFLVLSYSKLLFVSAILFIGTEIYSADGELVSYVLRWMRL